jgi:protein-arginine kinase activator protein McsA
MTCNSCGKQKYELHPKKSALNKSQTLVLCNDCIKGKKEPRYLIILFARANGAEAVADYIRNHRYCGAEITGKELVG